VPVEDTATKELLPKVMALQALVFTADELVQVTPSVEFITELAATPLLPTAVKTAFPYTTEVQSSFVVVRATQENPLVEVIAPRTLLAEVVATATKLPLP
jgi:hypothetical protein